jgi:hypothetical protein
MLKHAQPASLDLSQREHSTQRFAGLKHFYRRVNGDQAKRTKGPMGGAFVTRNPLLPDEYFEAGVDEFVVSLNRGVKHSLLDNPGTYTVQVATFTGELIFDSRQIERLQETGEVSNKLEVAADRAHRLTMALRRKGVEAYEFHSRHESIVTIGSFDVDVTRRLDGSAEMNPAMWRIMETYAAKSLPNGAVQPQQLDGIPFDVEPAPIRVPRRSVAAAYARRLGIFR